LHAVDFHRSSTLFLSANHSTPHFTISINLYAHHQLVMALSTQNSKLSPARVRFTVSYHFLHCSTNPNISSASALTDNTLHAFSRPGILVLINDADWELEGEASYALQANDNILFVSTLHGG
jgi:hypothetical protein